MLKTKISLATMQGKLTRSEMKQVMGGVNAPADDSEESCISDGKACSWTGKKCCNECLSSFKCGKKS
jgi:hypothetical protein